MSDLPRSVLAGPLAAAYTLLPARMNTPTANAMLLAIGLQESRLAHRRQIGGPARGLWQFEPGGGVRGVLNHPSSARLAAKVCLARTVDTTPSAVYAELEHDDVLAAAFARLLLWTDPRPLPELGDVDASWALYERTWRPGKPHRKTWNALYAQALEVVR